MSGVEEGLCGAGALPRGIGGRRPPPPPLRQSQPARSPCGGSQRGRHPRVAVSASPQSGQQLATLSHVSVQVRSGPTETRSPLWTQDPNWVRVSPSAPPPAVASSAPNRGETGSQDPRPTRAHACGLGCPEAGGLGVHVAPGSYPSPRADGADPTGGESRSVERGRGLGIWGRRTLRAQH